MNARELIQRIAGFVTGGRKGRAADALLAESITKSRAVCEEARRHIVETSAVYETVPPDDEDEAGADRAGK